MSLSDRLDRFLEQHALAPNEKPIRRDPTRPKAPGINAIRCSACGQIEYLTRGYCRCGHYLAGQIEDEYLAWVLNLAETHERLAEEAEQRMKPVRWAASISFPFLIWPLLQLLLFGQDMPFTSWLWTVPGLAVLGLLAVAEKFIFEERDASALVVQTASFEGFLNERLLVGTGASVQMEAE